MRRFSRRRYLAGVATAAGLAGCLGGNDSGSTPSGLTLDTVATASTDGGSVQVRPAGEPALVDFFATWCAPCKPQMAELVSVNNRFPDLHLVSITRGESEQEIKQFWADYKGTWPVATDPGLDAFQAYSVKGVPTKVLVGSDGTETWRHKGLASADTIAEQVEGMP